MDVRLYDHDDMMLRCQDDARTMLLLLLPIVSIMNVIVVVGQSSCQYRVDPIALDGPCPSMPSSRATSHLLPFSLLPSKQPGERSVILVILQMLF